jgi:N-acetylneuraminate synthase
METKRLPFVIAEIGINHIGNIDIARQLIDMAKNAGCDAVKFQKRTPDICVREKQKSRILETPWGTMTYLEYRHKVEFGKKEYDIIDDYCRQKDIEWFASAWDVESQLFLRQYNLKYNKVASPMLTNTPLLKAMAEEKKQTFISTGMSTYEDIDKAVDLFRKYNCPFTLMHCVSKYPISDEECNLLVMNKLKERYHCPVGYSGHEVSVLPTVVAAVLGAVVVDRHITLDRAMWGSDQGASLEKRGLELVTRDSKLVAGILGDGIKRVSPGEKNAAEKLRYFRPGEDME